MSFRYARLALCTLTLFATTSTVLGAGNDGSRPRNVAVSPDGQTILATSLGSDAITVFINGTRSHLDVGAPSWGVCFLDNLRAVVTVPSEDRVVLLERASTTGAFTDSDIDGSNGSFRGMTEVVPGTNADTVFLANRGKAPSGGDTWQHSVIELDVDAESVERALITEREPRALALSPLGGLLFVGTVQGALGAAGLASDNSDADTSFDGGSVVAYDLSSDTVAERFGIGSPVRGMAIWYEGSPETEYRLFCTNVGEGAQSESPDFGGRAIPNAITSFLFDDDEYLPSSRQDVVIKHDADLEPDSEETDSSDLPAVLPEKLVVRDGGSNFELWVTNSASGTVSVLELQSNGSISTDGTVNLLNELDTGDVFKVVTGRDGSGVPTLANASASNATVVYEIADEPENIRIDDLSASPSFEFSSNPRGIAYDSVNDELLVATQAGHQLVLIDGSARSVSDREDLATSPPTISEAELRFFTFGGGFDFREEGGGRKVNNLACGSCHVDGHIDGKVRLTVRPPQNHVDGEFTPHAVTVPSVFDAGNTEWIFFEGLITIADRVGVVDSESQFDCIYCEENQFFLDTIDFTDAVSSPASPWADGTLSSNAGIGRAIFDGMNCNRCHAEGAPMFLRTNDPEINSSELEGPIDDVANLLSDPTQVFISNGDLTKVEILGGSVRNMTNVGTRDTESDNFANGVNTPALAGAWDNAPYFHDGRYRTLEEVLEHTWVDADGLAAPIWRPATAPDNFSNDEQHPVTETELPLIYQDGDYEFQTHSPGSPGAGWQTVSSYLSSSEESALLEFLRSLSSQLDPYVSTTLTLSNLDEEAGDLPGQLDLSWNTNLSVVCRVTVENLDTSSVLETRVTAPGTSHAETITLDDVAEWKVTVEASYGSQRVDDDITFDTAPEIVVSSFSKTDVGMCSVQLTWNTNVSTACTLDWGVFGQGYPQNRETTAAGTSHSVTLNVSSGTKYVSKIWVPYQPVASDDVWKRLHCFTKQTPQLARGEVLSVSPNPFNPATEIRYTIPRQGRVELRIYDVMGRIVRSLVSAERTGGSHMEIWRGRDDTGASVASGVYFLQLEGPETSARQKLVLVE